MYMFKMKNMVPDFHCRTIWHRTIWHRTIWHQDNKSGKFGTRTIWHQDNLAPDNFAPGQKKVKKMPFFAISAKIRYHIFPEMLLYLKSPTCFSPPHPPPCTLR